VPALARGVMATLACGTFISMAPMGGASKLSDATPESPAWCVTPVDPRAPLDAPPPWEEPHINGAIAIPYVWLPCFPLGARDCEPASSPWCLLWCALECFEERWWWRLLWRCLWLRRELELSVLLWGLRCFTGTVPSSIHSAHTNHT